LAIVAALGCFYLGCSPQSTNSNANTMTTATPEPTPDKAAITTELTRIENDWQRIIKEHDGATVRRIEADDVIILYPDGSLGTKEEDAKAIESGAMTFDSWETTEVKVNVLSQDYAVATLRYTIKNAKIKSPDGKVIDVSGQYLSVDTFARRNGQWQFAALSSVQVKSPVATVTASPTPKPLPSASPAAIKPVSTPRPSPAARPTTRPSPAARPSVRSTPARAASPVSTP